MTQEYASLDKATRSTEQYLSKRIEVMEVNHRTLKELADIKEAENEELAKEVAELEAIFELKTKEAEEAVRAEMAEAPIRSSFVHDG